MKLSKYNSFGISIQCNASYPFIEVKTLNFIFKKSELCCKINVWFSLEKQHNHGSITGLLLNNNNSKPFKTENIEGENNPIHIGARECHFHPTLNVSNTLSEEFSQTKELVGIFGYNRLPWSDFGGIFCVYNSCWAFSFVFSCLQFNWADKFLCSLYAQISKKKNRHNLVIRDEQIIFNVIQYNFKINSLA